MLNHDERIHVCSMTHPNMWRGSSTENRARQTRNSSRTHPCTTWLIYIRDMRGRHELIRITTHSYTTAENELNHNSNDKIEPATNSGAIINASTSKSFWTHSYFTHLFPFIYRLRRRSKPPTIEFQRFYEHFKSNSSRTFPTQHQHIRTLAITWTRLIQ